MTFYACNGPWLQRASPPLFITESEQRSLSNSSLPLYIVYLFICPKVIDKPIKFLLLPPLCVVPAIYVRDFCVVWCWLRMFACYQWNDPRANHKTSAATKVWKRQCVKLAMRHFITLCIGSMCVSSEPTSPMNLLCHSVMCEWFYISMNTKSDVTVSVSFNTDLTL